MTTAAALSPVELSEKISCKICGERTHAMQIHLRDEHPDVSLAEYQNMYPGAPILSNLALAKLEEQKAKHAAANGSSPVAEAPKTKAEKEAPPVSDAIVKKAMNEVFGLGKVKAAFNARGEPIMISTVHDAESKEFIPEVDDGYVFDIEELKDVLLGIELNKPTLVWGHKGCGKSTLFEQIAARTSRPLMRVQHTVNTEESHIVGMWTVKDGGTVFELGPLPMAMKHGWVYMADEYDFGMPSVLSCYQAVLEGKSLVIKEADAANRIIKPHANFRFVATGNTNGSGDDSGLYIGTNVQNSANYDRFGVVLKKNYMAPSMETKVLLSQVRGLENDEAKKLAEFAKIVRDAFESSKISDTISPRGLINAADIGLRKTSMIRGLELSFINKLSNVDREVVTAIAQRVFGS